MPKYTVENSVSEERSTHGSWQAAMNAALRSALKAGGEDAVTITEKDMDGERVYNTAGEVMSRDGHFPRKPVDPYETAEVGS